jgi:hypothetical protein
VIVQDRKGITSMQFLYAWFWLQITELYVEQAQERRFRISLYVRMWQKVVLVE